MTAVPLRLISPEEYFKIDRKSSRAGEYYDGEIFPLVATTLEHSAIENNLGVILNKASAKSNCRVLPRMRTRLSETRYAYPDVVLVCGEPKLADERRRENLLNPKVIFEILSPSTADFDAGGKFRMYQKLPSFEEYVLIYQDQPRVELFQRSGDWWKITAVEGRSRHLTLATQNIRIRLAKLYEGIEFPASPSIFPSPGPARRRKQ